MNDFWDPFEGMDKPANDLRNSKMEDYYIMHNGRIFALERNLFSALAKAKDLGRKFGVKFDITKTKAGV